MELPKQIKTIEGWKPVQVTVTSCVLNAPLSGDWSSNTKTKRAIHNHDFEHIKSIKLAHLRSNMLLSNTLQGFKRPNSGDLSVHNCLY